MTTNVKKNYNGLKIVQWNAKSILLRYDKLVKQSTCNLFIISETWLSTRNFIIRGFDTVREDRIG